MVVSYHHCVPCAHAHRTTNDTPFSLCLCLCSLLLKLLLKLLFDYLALLQLDVWRLGEGKELLFH